MSWSQKEDFNGFVERKFEIPSKGRQVPGIYWEPKSGAKRLVMLGHGGTMHKRTGYILTLAHLFLQNGIAAVAIDGPGHGDRDPSGAWRGGKEEFKKAWTSGGGTDASTEDWTESLKFLEGNFGARPVGWWGVSMGTMMGIPLIASCKKISAACLGLMGNWGPNRGDLMRLAPEISCPVRFLAQWDDEIVPITSCLELFEKLGTKKKTLHGNPGAHAAIPNFEFTDSVKYLTKHIK